MSFQIITLLYFLGACLVLVISAEFLVKALLRVAQYYRLSEFVIGFMVVAFATVVPELFIGVTSALNGNSALALGNVIGANIIDLTLVIGIVTILRGGIKVETKAVRTDTLYMFFIIMLPLLLFMWDHRIDRVDGCVLLIAFILYVIRLVSQEKRFREKLETIPKKDFFLNVIISGVSIVLLFFSSGWVVEYASELAAELMVAPILIGLFLISFGTTLPELTFEAQSILTRHRYMALGDLIGNVVAKSTLVLGITAIIYPIEANFILFLTSSFFMLIVAFLFTTFIDVEKHILMQEGIALIILYILFIIIELNIRLISGP
jgi:cation:H+ antiporter